MCKRYDRNSTSQNYIATKRGPNVFCYGAKTKITVKVAIVGCTKHTHIGMQTLLYNTLISEPSDGKIIIKHDFFVSGLLFRQPEYTALAVNHLQKCWNIYKNYCKSSKATKGDQIMTCRDLLWMFQVHYIHRFVFIKEIYRYLICGGRYLILKM